MKRLFIYAVTAIALLSCTDEPECEPGNDEIRISALLAEVKPQTRTSIDGTGKAAWTNGDSLGLFCPQAKLAATNVKFSVAGLPGTPAWTPTTTIYWADANTSHTFLAYAPFASGNTSAAAVKLPALTPQTGTINPAQDFLISNNYGTTGLTRPSDATVGLTFKHAFSLIQLQITINSGIATGTTLKSCTLAGMSSDKMFTSNAASTIALSTGVITTTTGTTVNTLTATPASAPVLSGTPINFFIIILPGTYTPNLQFTLTEGGTDITVPAANVTPIAYAAGSKYVYQVSVSRTAILLSNPTITDWTSVPSGNINGGI